MAEADLVLVGTVLTMDPETPVAEAVAVRAGRIAYVGERAAALALAGGATRVVDLGDRVALPGFHDAHVHLTQHGLELSQLDLSATRSVREAVARIAERARGTAPGGWLLASGFALQRWGVTSLGPAERAALDAAVPERPVLVRSQDHHSAWVNGAALELAGVGPDTPDPANGTVVRDASGRPTGLLLERALELVRSRLPEPTEAELRSALAAAGADLASRGITTVHHMAYEPAAYWRALAGSASQDGFPLRVWACVPQEDIEHAAALGLATGQGGGRFQVGGAKFFADGALGSRTAWMLEPYGDGGRGVTVDGPEVLAERYPLAAAAGLTPVTHAIGDAANRAVLDALQASAEAWRAAGLRPRIEHAQHLHPADVARFAELGVVASMQPIHLTFDVDSVMALLGDRRQRAYPMRALLQSGAALAFGSDTPVAEPDVLAGLRAACRRTSPEGRALTPEQALEPAQALAAYTRGGAYAIGWEGRSGKLAEGFDADLVVLSHDPRRSLDDLAVQATLVAGRPTFVAGAFGGWT